MLTLTGLLKNVYTTNPGKSEDGKPYGGKDKIQIEIEQILKNDEVRLGFVDLTVADRRPFDNKVGQQVSIEVGVTALNGSIHYYAIAGGRVVE